MQLFTTLLTLFPLTIAQSIYTTVTTSSATASASAASSSAAIPPTSGTVISVDVGNGGLIFSPNSTNASVGDTLQFNFYPQNHSVALSTFTEPCVPANDVAIFSGFMPVAAGAEGNMTFNVVVNGTDPLWFYCSQRGHCEAGMVFVVNENTPSGNTLAAYAAAARGVSQSESPARVQGGRLAQASNSTSSPTSGTSTASATGATAATGSSSSTASASASPSSGAAGQYLGWNSVGSASIAALLLGALF